MIHVKIHETLSCPKLALSCMDVYDLGKGFWIRDYICRYIFAINVDLLKVTSITFESFAIELSLSISSNIVRPYQSIPKQSRKNKHEDQRRASNGARTQPKGPSDPPQHKVCDYKNRKGKL